MWTWLATEATAHLHALAGHERRVHRSAEQPERVPPSIQHLIAGWHVYIRQRLQPWLQNRAWRLLAAALGRDTPPKWYDGVVHGR